MNREVHDSGGRGGGRGNVEIRRARCAMCGHELPFGARPYMRYLCGWCEIVVAEEMRLTQDKWKGGGQRRMQGHSPLASF